MDNLCPPIVPTANLNKCYLKKIISKLGYEGNVEPYMTSVDHEFDVGAVITTSYSELDTGHSLVKIF